MPQTMLSFTGESGEEILIEIEEKSQERRRGEEDKSPQVKKVQKSFEQALDPVKQIANKTLAKLREINESPAEVSLEMGIKFNGEANVFVSKVGGEAHFTLCIKWTHESMKRAKEDNQV